MMKAVATPIIASQTCRVPTAERVRELFDYDPETGLFRRKVRCANVPAGTIAGCCKKDSGYVVISVDDHIYRAHQLAWLWMTGAWPERFVDHQDMNRSNNRWANLRLATKSQNMANCGKRRTNRGTLKGAWFYRAYNKWTSQIYKDGKQYFIGYFDTAEEAHAAYCRKGRELYGEFWRDE